MLLRSISELDVQDINKDESILRLGAESYIEVSIKDKVDSLFDSKKINLNTFIDWISNKINISCLDLILSAQHSLNKINELNSNLRNISTFIESKEINATSSLLKLSCEEIKNNMVELGDNYLYTGPTTDVQIIQGSVKFLQDIDGCALSAKWA